MKISPPKVIDAPEAVALIPDGATLAISGGGYRVAPEMMMSAIEAAFREEARPAGLTVMAVAMIERSSGGKGGEGTGLNRLATPGQTKRLIAGSFSRSKNSELSNAISTNTLEAYNYPMGTMVQWFRAIGSGRAGLFTQVGLHTFVDPRQEGGRSNDAAQKPLNRLVKIDDEEYLLYPSMPVDVAIIKGSSADERGNIYFGQEAFEHGVTDVAMAARNSGGIVIAEVNSFIPFSQGHPRFARVPSPLVDYIVLNPTHYEDEQDPVLTGNRKGSLTPVSPRNEPRDFIARIALSLVETGSMVNLGAGIPMYDVPEAARAAGRTDLYFTVEQGPMGGWPKAGGVSRHPDGIWPQLDVFDFYEGGGPDVSILSFGQVDGAGNVNVSKFGGMMPGCGGFTNIVHGVKNLIFCGTLTTGGLDETVTPEGLVISTEGRVKKFVAAVEQITMNARHSLAGGAQITFVTDRGVFSLSPSGLTLTHISPGLDVDRDIANHVDFDFAVSPTLQVLNHNLLTPTTTTKE